MSITVCIATYNGSAFLEKQLISILSQLNKTDFVVISDDCSLDDTISKIINIGDKRLIVNQNNKNEGHVRNFEKVLSQAHGDIIFLSDQDDIWHPKKVQKIMDIFESDPDIVMVHHSLSSIDDNDVLLSQRYNSLEQGYQSKIKYMLRQFAKPEVFGCAVAFRRELLDKLLPFPSFVYAHDHWIAIASGFAGKVFFLDEPLVEYRQHANNITPKKSLPLLKILKNRFLFLQMVWVAFKRFKRKNN